MFVTFPYETGFWLLFCLVYRLSLDFCKLCSLNFYWVLGFFSFFLPPFACLLCLVIRGYQFYYVLKNYFALMVKCLFFICYLIHLIFSFLCCWIHSFKSVFINNLSLQKSPRAYIFRHRYLVLICNANLATDWAILFTLRILKILFALLHYFMFHGRF